MKLLDDYKSRIRDFPSDDDGTDVTALRIYQELSYRVSVLETWKVLIDYAPDWSDVEAVKEHKALLIPFCKQLPYEHLMGIPEPTEKEIKKASTAQKVLETVLEDCLMRVTQFDSTSGQSYRDAICGIISAISKVWLQFRMTLLDVK